MLSLAILALSAIAAAVPYENAADKRQATSSVVAAAPTVTGTAPQATYIGGSLAGVDTFNGIPFAVPPVGTNRLYRPSAISTSLGTVVATGVPAACPQQTGQAVNTTFLPAGVTDLVAALSSPPAVQSEDCLTLNVQRPANTTAGAKLPVLFWIYGGGFEFGSTSMYDGSNLVSKSVSENASIIYVEANYRLNGFGFLAGQEVLDAGVSNLGLLDQRLALEWVADNIAAFGGDPLQVTIWGESAGSISVFDQMALYDGNNNYKGQPLFHGAIMDSGSVLPANPVNTFKAEAIYDQVTAYSGCNSTANSLQCLRGLPYQQFYDAVTSVPGIFSYQSLDLSYLPRPDGTVLTKDPLVLAATGNFAQIPFIIGDQEDEGTLFSLSQSNLTTTTDVVNYLYTNFFPTSTISRVAGYVATYPDNATAGSPFGTGDLNEVYPEYKRLAAILGDVTFTLQRRILLSLSAANSPSIPTYSYLASYLHGTPVLGTFHASDLLELYGPPTTEVFQTISQYYISFVNTLNPNTIHGNVSSISWPKWISNQTLVQFQNTSNNYLADNFRSQSFAYLVNNEFKL